MISRRNFLKTTTLGAGIAGAMALGTTNVARADSGLSKEQAGYQETPHGAQRCELCRKFKPPAACDLVSGPVNPNGWCHFFSVTG